MEHVAPITVANRAEFVDALEWHNLAPILCLSTGGSNVLTGSDNSEAKQVVICFVQAPSCFSSEILSNVHFVGVHDTELEAFAATWTERLRTNVGSCTSFALLGLSKFQITKVLLHLAQMITFPGVSPMVAHVCDIVKTKKIQHALQQMQHVYSKVEAGYIQLVQQSKAAVGFTIIQQGSKANPKPTYHRLTLQTLKLSLPTNTTNWKKQY